MHLKRMLLFITIVLIIDGLNAHMETRVLALQDHAFLFSLFAGVGGPQIESLGTMRLLFLQMPVILWFACIGGFIEEQYRLHAAYVVTRFGRYNRWYAKQFVTVLLCCMSYLFLRLVLYGIMALAHGAPLNFDLTFLPWLCAGFGNTLMCFAVFSWVCNGLTISIGPMRAWFCITLTWAGMLLAAFLLYPEPAWAQYVLIPANAQLLWHDAPANTLETWRGANGFLLIISLLVVTCLLLLMYLLGLYWVKQRDFLMSKEEH